MSLWGKRNLKNDSHEQIAKDIVNLLANENINISDASDILEFASHVINDPVDKYRFELMQDQGKKLVQKITC